jgi:ribosome-associated protein
MDAPDGLLRLAPQVTVPNAALTWESARSSGPGGQGVNTTNSKAILRVDVRAIQGLSIRAQDRFIELAGERLTEAMELVLHCDETRSLRQNRDLLLERLCELAREAQAVPRPRKPTRPGRGAIQRRLAGKAHRSTIKRERRTGQDD